MLSLGVKSVAFVFALFCLLEGEHMVRGDDGFVPQHGMEHCHCCLENLDLGPSAWRTEEGSQTCSTAYSSKFCVKRMKGRRLRVGRRQKCVSLSSQLAGHSPV